MKHSVCRCLSLFNHHKSLSTYPVSTNKTWSGHACLLECMMLKCWKMMKKNTKLQLNFLLPLLNSVQIKAKIMALSES